MINLGIWTTSILTNKHFLSLSHLPIYAPSWSGRELFEHPSYVLTADSLQSARNILHSPGQLLREEKYNVIDVLQAAYIDKHIQNYIYFGDKFDLVQHTCFISPGTGQQNVRDMIANRLCFVRMRYLRPTYSIHLHVPSGKAPLERQWSRSWSRLSAGQGIGDSEAQQTQVHRQWNDVIVVSVLSSRRPFSAGSCTPLGCSCSAGQRSRSRWCHRVRCSPIWPEGKSVDTCHLVWELESQGVKVQNENGRLFH